MKQLPVPNPFNAPVYHEETVTSTMEVSRILARQGEAHGTVIVADFQEAGRGRISKRLWDMERESGLPFTILLRYPRIEDIPPAITLRTGLAVSLAIEEFAPALSTRVMIKWPNDIILAPDNPDATGTVYAKKAVGILAEADGGNVHIGIGMNVSQKKFPDHLHNKATSIYLAVNHTPCNTYQNMGKNMANLPSENGEGRFMLLEKILAHLYAELTPAGNGSQSEDWKSRIEARLYKKGEQVNFAESAADSGIIVSGILAGIGDGGELLIAVSGKTGETTIQSFTTGELLLDNYMKQ
jgi:BirA family biotin operon repressor/biotin-[acetyl-CoA-carboxylase] ligase